MGRLGGGLAAQVGLFGLGGLGEALPPLRLIHSSEVIEGNFKFLSLNNLTTEELIDSLASGAEEPLIVAPDGAVLQGNTRIYILMQRGVDVNALPRTGVPH